MLNKRKKTVKFRGHHTHGYGSKKKHRGAGHRGGVGMAGTGKRGDQKRPSIWKDEDYFGRHGFTSKSKKLRSINLFHIEEHLDLLLKEGKIIKDGEFFVVDLKNLKADKLLASGNTKNKYKITCSAASAKAIEKITSVGGTMEIKKKVEKKPPEAPKKAPKKKIVEEE